MAIRRAPGNLPGMSMPMAPRPGMTGAPANNPGPGMPGPQSGASGMPAGPGGPGAGDPSSMMPPPPPPIQPNAGGPTSPMNISDMLTPQQQPPDYGAKTPLPAWGDSSGTPGTPGGTGAAPAPGMPGDPSQDMGGGTAAQIHAGSPSLVMLRMLRALGQL